MATLAVYNLESEQVGTIEVADDVFAVEVRHHLFYDVVKWQLARRRQGTHATKGRQQVRGGGKKPYKQKGTGNARQGRRRAPNHVGGGVVHGPQPRSYAYNINKTMRRAALRAALSLRASSGDLVVVKTLGLPDVKTSNAARIFGRLGDGNALVVDAENRELELSTRNLPSVKYLNVAGLNVYDVLMYKKLVVSEAMVRRIEGALGQ